MKTSLSVRGLIILSFIIVPLISANFLLLYKQQQAKAQTNTTSANATLPNRQYINTTYGIKMNYTSNWTVNDKAGAILLKSLQQNSSSAQNQNYLRTLHLLAFFNPNSTEGVGTQTIAPTVLSLAVKDNVEGFSSAKKYVDEIVKQQKIIKPNFQSQNTSSTIAEKLIFSGKDEQNRLTKTMNIAIMKDSKIYLLVFSSSPTNYVKFLPSVEQMINSLTIS